VETLRQRGVRPALVLDEGGAIVEPGLIAGVDAPLAVIGVTEKGITSVALTVDQQGGHASTPPLVTATARLARAIDRLTRSPFPVRMNDAVIAFVESLAQHSTGARAQLFRRARPLAPIVGRLFSRLGDEPRAMVRTTAAVTQLRGSDGANVLAERASAVVNVRVAVGSSVDEAVRHIRRSIADGRVAVDVLHASEPSPVSPSTGAAWDRLAGAVQSVYPVVSPTPYTMLGASDARHFTRISDFVYRLTPFELHAEHRATLHARDEHIDVATWLRGIDVYEHVLRAS
jgi:carboxypeptidase PM20D1